MAGGPPPTGTHQHLLLSSVVVLAILTRLRSVQATLERSESDSRQRLNNQLEKQEREISQLQKRLEQEVEQRHLHGRNQEVYKYSNGVHLKWTKDQFIIRCCGHLEPCTPLLYYTLLCLVVWFSVSMLGESLHRVVDCSSVGPGSPPS